MDKDFECILQKAKEISKKVVLNEYIYYGHVSCAIMSKSGNIYSGLSINSKCNLGNCAEQAAVLEMLKYGEHVIKKMVVYSSKGNIYIPCGKCREFIKMIDNNNMNTQILMPDFSILTLSVLLPFSFIRTE